MAKGIRDAQNKLTEDAISNAFLKLLSEKDVHKITVKDICEHAGVNRGTFYLHYIDIVDLIDRLNSWYIDRAVQFYRMEFDSFGDKIDSEALEAGVRGHLTLLASWPLYAEIVFGRGLCPQFFDKLNQACDNEMREHIKKGGSSLDVRKAEYDYAFGAAGVTGIMQKWCKDGLTESVDTITDYIVSLLRENNFCI